jgi:hypothetical protein
MYVCIEIINTLEYLKEVWRLIGKKNIFILLKGKTNMQMTKMPKMKLGVVMVHELFSYAPCINNENCLVHPLDF